MKTIGQYLKETRLQKKYTLDKLEELTKIRKEFLRAIETERWQALPEYPVVLGFVKSIAGFLETDESKAVALLRRDYPPHRESLNPKPDLPTKEFAWSPRLTFLIGVVLISLIIIGYLGFQYFQFIQPPRLEVYEPKQDEVITTNTYAVRGKTNPDASINVNNQPVSVTEEGIFEAEIEISGNTTEIVFKAMSRSGKESSVSRRIKTELK